MTTEDLSREIILDHYQNPRNHGRLSSPTVANRGHNPLCGDEVELSLLISDDRIDDIAFSGRGCSISQASASMMTETAKGHSLSDVREAIQRFTQSMANRSAAPRELEDELDALQGVKRYPARVKCALLPWTTLRESLDLFEHRNGATTDHADALANDCADAP
jgi:nitrogen fixation protein NifU and related proteins